MSDYDINSIVAHEGKDTVFSDSQMGFNSERQHAEVNGDGGGVTTVIHANGNVNNIEETRVDGNITSGSHSTIVQTIDVSEVVVKTSVDGSEIVVDISDIIVQTLESSTLKSSSDSLDTTHSNNGVNGAARDDNTINNKPNSVADEMDVNVRVGEAGSTTSSTSNSKNNSTTNIATPNINGENLRSPNSNSINFANVAYNIGIVADSEDSSSEVDEFGGRFKKGKRKERSHSKIVLQHKKNLLGETIYKGHQSWVLMMNIQTGIRNAVGKGSTQSRNNVTSPRILSPSQSQPQPAMGPLAATLVQSHSQPNPAQQPSPVSPAPRKLSKYSTDGVLTPDQFDKLAEFFASPRVLQFPSAGSSQTIPHQTGPFKFKDYCPHAFRFLRHRFGIDTADYMVSLCNTQKNGENALRELPTPGKSGSLFFFSHDMRFILKTIPKSEAKLLRYLLPSYVEHIADDENTLLPKFFGLHRVKPHRGRQVRFVVMGNVFQTKKKIHERYDLKGSTLGRQASEEEKKKENVTYKDLDFRERHMKIQIGPQKRGALLDQLQRDCKFLGQLNIMDYSLLIGIHYQDREEVGDRSSPPSPQMPIPVSRNDANRAATDSPDTSLPQDRFHSIFQTSDGGMRALDEHGEPVGRHYYMGIIDILMLYSVRKKLEHTYKTIRYKKSGEEISSISAPEYASRFYDFLAASIT